MSVAFDAREEGFRRTETQVEVQAYGQMVQVVGHEEGDDFSFPVFLVVFHQRENQAPIIHAVFRLEIFLSAIDQRLFLDRFPRRHLEEDPVSYPIVGGIVGTGLQKDAQHVEDTFVPLLVRMNRAVFRSVSLLADVAFVSFVGEPYFVYRIALPFFRSFSEIPRLQLAGGDAGQRVAHLEEVIDFSVCGRVEHSGETRFAVVSGGDEIHLRIAGIQPHEFPVELQFISQFLTGLYGIVGGDALRIRSKRETYQGQY